MLLNSTVVHHNKLNIDFVIKLEPETFKEREDNEAIECFEDSSCNGNCRKFLKSYLILKNMGPDDQVPKRKRRTKKEMKETIELESEEIELPKEVAEGE